MIIAAIVILICGYCRRNSALRCLWFPCCLGTLFANLTPVQACENLFWRHVNNRTLESLTHGAVSSQDNSSSAVLIELRKAADQSLKTNPAPVSRLRSAGETDPHGPELRATRRAFADADRAAILALAYRLLGDERYLHAARAILLQWAEVNVPTGHPIDETRLDGLLWSYDLVCNDLDAQSRNNVAAYFNRIHTAKVAWKFGPRTRNNNHRTHQIKSLLLLAQVTGNQRALDDARQQAVLHTTVNLDADTGASRDYTERDALYYHAFNLDAWLEIALLSDCCLETVKKSFWFGMHKLQKQDIGGEFAHSSASIDQRRDQAGFHYAKAGSTFDEKRYTRSILAYSTLVDSAEDTGLWKAAIRQPVERKNLFYLARQVLWTHP